MPAEKVELPDDGILMVAFQGNEYPVDSFEACNRLQDLREALSGKPAFDYLAAVVDLMVQRYKFPPTLTHKAAYAFEAAVYKAVAPPGKASESGAPAESPRLSRFYGFWCGDLTERQQWELESARVPLWADEFLSEHGRDLAADDLHKLTLLATGDERAANRAKQRRIHADLAAGKQVEV